MLSTSKITNPVWVPHPHHSSTYHQYYHLQPNHDHQNYMHDLDQNVQEHDHPLNQSIDEKRPTRIQYKREEEEEVERIVRHNKRPLTADHNMNYQDDDQDSPTRVCIDCKASKTPLWRSGPSGPKTLCNACGIRYRKKRRREYELLKMKFKGQEEEAEAALLLMALSCVDRHHHQ